VAGDQQLDQQGEQKDQNVFSFMMQLVQEKHGDEIEFDFLQREAEQLYELFGDSLLSYFEPQLSPDQKQQFDQLIESEEDQEVLLNFLMENISDLEQQIVQMLVSFRGDYLAGKFQADSAPIIEEN
jgi:hypothetical protein